MSRSEAKAIAEENGAKILGSVSKNLNYLVIGDSKPTKKKIEKAKKLKIDLITEEKWYDLLNRWTSFRQGSPLFNAHKFTKISFNSLMIIIYPIYFFLV